MSFNPITVQVGTDYATSAEEIQMTLATQPVEGNLLVAGGNVLSTSRQLTAPAGWTAVRDFQSGTDDVVIFFKIAGPSEGTVFDFPVDNAGTLKRMSMAEYSGVSGASLDVVSINPVTSSVTTVSTGTTPPPSTTDAFAVAFFGPERDRTSQPTNGFAIDIENISGGTDVQRAVLASKHVTDGATQESSIDTVSSDRGGAVMVVFVEPTGAIAPTNPPQGGEVFSFSGSNYAGQPTGPMTFTQGTRTVSRAVTISGWNATDGSFTGVTNTALPGVPAAGSMETPALLYNQSVTINLPDPGE